MNINNGDSKGNEFGINVDIIKLIYENIALTDNNIRLIHENARLMKRIEDLEQLNRKHADRCLSREGEDYIVSLVIKRGKRDMN